jgi:hypothetical protein
VKVVVSLRATFDSASAPTAELTVLVGLILPFVSQQASEYFRGGDKGVWGHPIYDELEVRFFLGKFPDTGSQS